MELMKEVKLILNYIITRPLMVSSSITFPLIRYKAWNCPSLAIEYLEALVSIMTL
jgi:hypothetical protein